MNYLQERNEMLTGRFDEAFLFAHNIHRDQRRKGTSIRYISHLMQVSAIVVEYGGDEDQAIAALLHDAAEDQGGEPTLDEIRRRFGSGVAQIVFDCTDSWTEAKPDWKPRKEAYIAAMRARSQRSMLVSLADNTHNSEAIMSDFAMIGDRVWERFAGGAAGTRWYYSALVDVFEERLPGPLTNRLKRAIRGFDHV